MTIFLNMKSSLLREGLLFQKADCGDVASLSDFPATSWNGLFREATQQGVGAIAYDGL